MIDKKKAVPPQNSQIYNFSYKTNYNKKVAVIKQFKSHMSEYRDYIIGTYDCVDEARDHVLQLINRLEMQKQLVNFRRTENSFSSKDYTFSIFVAQETIGYQGQAGFFSLTRRSASNVFIRLPVWQPITDVPAVLICCSAILTIDAERLDQSAQCSNCSLTIDELAGQFAYQQVKLEKKGFSEPALLTELETLRLAGVKFELLAALRHAILLSDATVYSYCSIGERGK